MFHHILRIDDFHHENVAACNGKISVVDLFTSCKRLDSIIFEDQYVITGKSYQIDAFHKLFGYKLQSLISGTLTEEDYSNEDIATIRKMLYMIWITSKAIQVFQDCKSNDYQAQIQLRVCNDGSPSGAISWINDNCKLLNSFILHAKELAQQSMAEYGIIKGADKKNWGKYWNQFQQKDWTEDIYKNVIEALQNNCDFLSRTEDSKEFQSYKEEIKMIIEQFNQRIQSFLITNQDPVTTKYVSNILEIFFSSQYNNDDPKNRKHIIIVFCENTAEITTIPVEFLLNENRKAKQKIVIFVDNFFLYDTMLQFFIIKNAEKTMSSNIKQIHSEFLHNITIPSDKIKD